MLLGLLYNAARNSGGVYAVECFHSEYFGFFTLRLLNTTNIIRVGHQVFMYSVLF